VKDRHGGALRCSEDQRRHRSPMQGIIGTTGRITIVVVTMHAFFPLSRRERGISEASL
jgi:hypothetical protein